MRLFLSIIPKIFDRVFVDIDKLFFFGQGGGGPTPVEDKHRLYLSWRLCT